MIIDEGLACNAKQLQRLYPVIEGWFSAIHRYERTVPAEPPYWFNERANLSIFAAGAWMRGAIAIEEYACEKDRGEKKRIGRADLYIGTAEWDASFEAKIGWMRASFTNDDLMKTINSKIDLALNDVKKVYDTHARIGMCFYIPRFSKRRFKDFTQRANEYISAELKRYLEYKAMHLWAWSFPKSLRLSLSGVDGSYYPGVILGLKAQRLWKN